MWLIPISIFDFAANGRVLMILQTFGAKKCDFQYILVLFYFEAVKVQYTLQKCSLGKQKLMVKWVGEILLL